jgi:hypothetical protein
MQSGRRSARARDFLLGGIVGGAAAAAAARRRRLARRRREQRLERPAGLAAFEGAPCFEELLEEQAARTDS